MEEAMGGGAKVREDVSSTFVGLLELGLRWKDRHDYGWQKKGIWGTATEGVSQESEVLVNGVTAEIA
jgi:hypothetical protein